MDVDLNVVAPAELDSSIESDRGGAPRRRYPGAFSSDQPTPFEKSYLADVADDLKAEVEDPLFNARDPHYAILHEQPHHRVIIDYRSQGFTVKEIAERTGFTTVCVSNVLRQPWAQKRLTEGVNNVRQATMESIVAETQASWQKLLTIRDDPSTPAAVAAKVCESHLDRVFGRATQPLAVFDGVDLDKVSDEELAKLLPLTGATATASPKG